MTTLSVNLKCYPAIVTPCLVKWEFEQMDSIRNNFSVHFEVYLSLLSSNNLFLKNVITYENKILYKNHEYIH